MSAQEMEPTLGELMRKLDEVASEVKLIPVRINDDYVRRETYLAKEETRDHQITAMEKAALVRDEEKDKRLKILEDRQEWVIRIVIGLVIAGLVGLLFATTH